MPTPGMSELTVSQEQNSEINFAFFRRHLQSKPFINLNIVGGPF